jgi:hypothetical protein
MYRYITQLVSKARTFLMTHESRRFVPLFTVEALCDRCRYDTGTWKWTGATRRGCLNTVLLGRHL